MNELPVITTEESARLVELEAIIERGLESFIAVGNALKAIRDEFRNDFGRLGYKNFEHYCQSKWGFTRMFAHYQIKGAETAANVNNCLQAPISEGQVRPLTPLEPETQREVWQAAVESAGGGQPTGKQVAAAKANGPPCEGEPFGWNWS